MRIIQTDTVTWYDFQNPQKEDIAYMKKNFDVHPLAIEEFRTPTFRPRASHYKNCFFLTVHIPLFDPKKRTTYSSEIDIIVTKDYIVTGHEHPIFELDTFYNQIEKDIKNREYYMSESPAHLLYHILNMLFEACFPRLDHITHNTKIIEEGVFSDREKEMVREIAITKRDILNFRETIKPQRSVLESLIQTQSQFMPKEAIPYFYDLVGTNIRLWHTLESSKETIESLESTNNSLLSTKLNLTIKVLTIFSALTLPISMYVNIFSIINSSKESYRFIIHITIILVIILLITLIFKKKRWL